MSITGRRPSEATPQQRLFATLYATTDLSLTACFRQAYPQRGTGRKPATEWRAAARLARNLKVIREMELAAPLDPRRMKREALITLWRVDQGALDPRHGQNARARLREANRMLREAAQGSERRLRREAWKMFNRAVSWIYQGRYHAGPPLSPRERTELIFARFAPVALPESIASTAPPVRMEQDVAEIEEFASAQQLARTDDPEPVPSPESLRPRAGCFPQLEASGSADDSAQAIAALRAIATGTPPPSAGKWVWETRPIPGRFGRGAFQRRQVWVPAEESSGENL